MAEAMGVEIYGERRHPSLLGGANTCWLAAISNASIGCPRHAALSDYSDGKIG